MRPIFITSMLFAFNTWAMKAHDDVIIQAEREQLYKDFSSDETPVFCPDIITCYLFEIYNEDKRGFKTYFSLAHFSKSMLLPLKRNHLKVTLFKVLYGFKKRGGNIEAAVFNLYGGRYDKNEEHNSIYDLKINLMYTLFEVITKINSETKIPKNIAQLLSQSGVTKKIFNKFLIKDKKLPKYLKGFSYSQTYLGSKLDGLNDVLRISFGEENIINPVLLKLLEDASNEKSELKYCNNNDQELGNFIFYKDRFEYQRLERTDLPLEEFNKIKSSLTYSEKDNFELFRNKFHNAYSNYLLTKNDDELVICYLIKKTENNSKYNLFNLYEKHKKESDIKDNNIYSTSKKYFEEIFKQITEKYSLTENSSHYLALETSLKNLYYLCLWIINEKGQLIVF